MLNDSLAVVGKIIAQEDHAVAPYFIVAVAAYTEDQLEYIGVLIEKWLACMFRDAEQHADAELSPREGIFVADELFDRGNNLRGDKVGGNFVDHGFEHPNPGSD